MNLLNRVMLYDKKIENQENCNCREYKEINNIEITDDFLRKIENYQMLCKEKELLTILNLKYWYKDIKTKIFIWKALKIHGNKYDYSKVKYKNVSSNVCIICKKHKESVEFWQTPNNHLRFHGCPKCAKKSSSEAQRMSLKEFVERARKIHGDKYDYSKVNYINANTKVCIICNNHDEPYEFWQSPDVHLRGFGCSKCSGLKRLTLEEFIQQSNIIHGEGRYDYSKVKYKNNRTKVCIICNNHDKPYEFWQKPSAHLNGEGCPICAIESSREKLKMSLEEFIEKANKVHGKGRYDYSKVKYINAFTKVCIICHEHKKPYEFWQKPSAHLNSKNGCPMCKESQGEKNIRIFLMNNDIEFEREKRFDDCKNINSLPFDFYLPQYNLCIEHDGRQHFVPSDFGSTMTEEKKLKNFKLSQHRDQIKNDYCKKNKINLLRIRYDENVEEKLI